MLLTDRADPDRGSLGEDPPLCVAVRHRMRAIVRTLLMHRANVEVKLLPHTSTPLQLAEGDAPLCDLLIEFGALGRHTHDV